MAHLEVKPKRNTPWWAWLLAAIIAIALLLFFLKGCNSKSTGLTGSDSTNTSDTALEKQPLAVTEPDWNSVDFNLPKAEDPSITDKDITMSGNDQYTIYTLGENIIFATDQNTIEGNADAKLKQIVASLNKRFKGASIGVFGNTDSTGTAGHNKELGSERAAAVKWWLVSNGGLDSAKISVRSSGENKPVASNTLAAGREQNRNVKIVAFPATK